MKTTAEDIANRYYKSISDLYPILEVKSRKAIDRLLEEGRLKGIKVLGKTWILKESVTEYLHSLEQEALIN